MFGTKNSEGGGRLKKKLKIVMNVILLTSLFLLNIKITKAFLRSKKTYYDVLNQFLRFKIERVYSNLPSALLFDI